MPLYRTEVIFPMFTNQPTDVIANNFHFLDDVTNIEALTSRINTALTNFYNIVYSNTAAAKVPYVDWAQAVTKTFNLSEPTPRVPFIRAMPTVQGTATSTTLPTEVACVLSFRAAQQSGVAYQRLYNRIFLGALHSNDMSAAAADQFPRFTSAFTTRIANAAIALHAEVLPATEWVQVSKAGGLTAVRPIVGGWVDNGPDTQRRRSVLATLRNNWLVSP